VNAVAATEIVSGDRVGKIIFFAIPAIDEAIDSVLKCPLDFKVCDGRILLVIISHKRGAIGKLVKIVKAFVKPGGSFLPCSVVVYGNNSVTCCGFGFRNIL
jgi:hypothetical protein